MTLGCVDGRCGLLIDPWALLQIVTHGEHLVCHPVHHWCIQAQLAAMHHGSTIPLPAMAQPQTVRHRPENLQRCT
jgi:hypothetical protein